MLEVTRPGVWPMYWFTLDADGRIRRSVSCFSSGKCYVRAMTDRGELAYQTLPDTPRDLKTWTATEADLIALFSSWES